MAWCEICEYEPDSDSATCSVKTREAASCPYHKKEVKMTTNEQVLKAYGDELGVLYPLTAEELVSSHRYLRSRSMISDADLHRERIAARSAGYEAGLKKALEEDYIEVASLKNMTIREIVERFGDSDR